MAASDFTDLVAAKPDGTLTPHVLAKLKELLGLSADTGLLDPTVWAPGWGPGSPVAGWTAFKGQMKQGTLCTANGLITKSSGWADNETICKLPDPLNPNRRITGHGIQVMADGYVQTIGANSSGGTVGVSAIWIKQ